MRIGETPPRTWRRLSSHTDKARVSRNTSTDVEKTSSLQCRFHPSRKHLHGRGEDFEVKDDRGRISGNTSTDVEKTKFPNPSANPSRKHLHGRGEDDIKPLAIVGVLETPPRTWRRQVSVLSVVCLLGNTSTDVEKTTGKTIDMPQDRKHLHGRGEDDP